MWRLRRLVMGSVPHLLAPFTISKTLAPLRRGFFLANDPNALAGVLSQPKRPRFMAYLILIPAQEARRGCECITVIERVPEVFKVHFGPRLA